MKKFAFIFLSVCILSLIFVNCTNSSSDSNFQIKVSGSTGVKFSGYLAITSSGHSSSRSVEGIVPADYSVKSSVVSALLQNQGDNGLLKVEIWESGKLVNEASTSAAYGVVSVSTD